MAFVDIRKLMVVLSVVAIVGAMGALCLLVVVMVWLAGEEIIT